MKLSKTSAFFTAPFLFCVSATLPADGGVDLHRMWDDRCAECHGHSGDFARQFLSVYDGNLMGPHHREDLKRFMENHYLARSEVDSVYDMLHAQAISEPRFREECTGCHDSAVELVRRSLALHGDVLFNRKSGKPVDLPGSHHAGLGPDDVLFFTDLLARIAREVGQE